MDSGNTSSMQSSSGPDDDVDSKAESSMSMPSPVPLFLDHNALYPLCNYHNLNNTFLPSSLMFEPDYLPHAACSSQTQKKQDPAPSTHLHLETYRLDPNYTSLSGGLPASLSSSPRQTMLVPQGLERVQQYPGSLSSVTTAKETTKPVKNPRKRTRVSRRAPTTVLNTDTSNFRVMVQEFTGFPAPPFSESRKLDLLTSGSTFDHDPLGKMFQQRTSAQNLPQPPLMADSGDRTSNTKPNFIINNALMSTITSSIAQVAASADTDKGPISPFLNLPKNTSGNHPTPIPVPNSNILAASFPSLMHDPDPVDTPIPGSLHHFDGNINRSAQDHGLHARATDMSKPTNIAQNYSGR